MSTHADARPLSVTLFGRGQFDHIKLEQTPHGLALISHKPGGNVNCHVLSREEVIRLADELMILLPEVPA